MTPLTAQTALDAYFLEARCKLLDLAAILDRIDRGSGNVNSSVTKNDPRLEKIRTAIATLNEAGTGRAEKIQQLFSLPYDPAWPLPAPK
jgi:hypothetical protein